MMQVKRNTRRTMSRLALAAGLGLLAIVLPAGPTHGQVAVPPPSAGATTRPATAAPAAANRLVADGLDADGKVRVTVNKTVVLTTTQPYKQVSVGSPDIADVNLIGPQNILVTAKKAGSTQLILWDDNNRSQVADVIVGMDLEALQTELNTAFPGSKITVTAMNSSLALKGTAPDLKTAEQAATMAAAYSPRVMNMIEVAGGQQVLLQVRFAEVSRKATNALGVNFGIADGVSFLGSNIGQVSPLTIADGVTPPALGVPPPSPSVTLFGRGVIGGTAIDYFITALRQNNLLRILAEPNLVAISGQEASFLAGGEFPVPVPQSGTGGGTTITVEYREFGVRLNFVPVVLGDGKIRVKLSPEVSDLDFSSPLVIQGSRIPIINKRTVTTTIELADGQTFAIAGLLDHAVNATKDVTPGLGDLPIIGALFRSVRYERRETELLVLVTPRLVEPMNPNQVPPLPGESWRHPKELDLYLKQDIGSENAGKSSTGPSATTPATTSGGQAAAGNPRYRGTYGFTPPPRATTTGAHD